jgi:hypothetical protein
MQDSMWQDPERVVAFVGSIISFVSVLVNIAQWVTNRSLKKTLRTVMHGASNAFQAILAHASDMNHSGVLENDCLVSGIIAHAERGKDQVQQAIGSLLD